MIHLPLLLLLQVRVIALTEVVQVFLIVVPDPVIVEHFTGDLGRLTREPEPRERKRAGVALPLDVGKAHGRVTVPMSHAGAFRVIDAAGDVDGVVHVTCCLSAPEIRRS